jgi:excisionase family DNA binding protein
VRRWIKSGELVAHHFGNAVRIAESDLKHFIARHRDP